MHLDCEIGKKIHKIILPFLELKKDEIDVDCYKCESIVSSVETSDAYRIGLDKIESYIQAKDNKNILKHLLDKNDKRQIKYNTILKFESLSTKLSSDNKLNAENTFEFDEDSDMSEISVVDEVDCSKFIKNELFTAKVLISEDSVEFSQISKTKPEVLKAKAIVFLKSKLSPTMFLQQKDLTKTKPLN